MSRNHILVVLIASLLVTACQQSQQLEPPPPTATAVPTYTPAPSVTATETPTATATIICDAIQSQNGLVGGLWTGVNEDYIYIVGDPDSYKFSTPGIPGEISRLYYSFTFLREINPDVVLNFYGVQCYGEPLVRLRRVTRGIGEEERQLWPELQDI